MQFNPSYISQVRLINFALYNARGEKLPTVLLDQTTDPNGRLSEREFVLFPVNRLEWGESYRVEAVFEVNGLRQDLSWTFRTRSLPYPSYRIEGSGGEVPVKSGITYALYFVPLNGTDIITGFRYSYPQGVSVVTDFIDLNTLRVKLSGEVGDRVEFYLNDGRTVALTISTTDSAQYPGGQTCVHDGDVAPLGKRDGKVNIGDALVTLRFALGLEVPSDEDKCHADVAPLGPDGKPQPDGKITIGDALVILRKALNLINW